MYDDERPKPKPKPKSQLKPKPRVEPELDDEGYWSSGASDVKEKDEEIEQDDDEDINRTPLHWPTPIHDVLFGYSWITQNLLPKYPKRKDVYICGSYLGASLAAGLALSESYPHARMAVRGLITYNGIYDWTTFLPDHPIHRPKGDDRILIESQLQKLNRDLDEDSGPAATSPIIAHYQRRLEDLFGSPSGLFDNFASACLFFHTAGLFVPPTFHERYVPEWLLPPPPGPLITGASGAGVNGAGNGQGQHINDPHDPFTPPTTSPQPEPPFQDDFDFLDPDDFDHYVHTYEEYGKEMSMANYHDLDLGPDPDNSEPFEQGSQGSAVAAAEDTTAEEDIHQQQQQETLQLQTQVEEKMSMVNDHYDHHDHDLDLNPDDFEHPEHFNQSEPDSPDSAIASLNPEEDIHQHHQTLQLQHQHQTQAEEKTSMVYDASGEPDSVAAADLICEVHRHLQQQDEALKVQIIHAKFPRKSYVHFPSRHSMLKLPDTLLLYETPSAEELPPFKCDALARLGVEGSGAMSLSARYRKGKGKEGKIKEGKQKGKEKKEKKGTKKGKGKGVKEEEKEVEEGEEDEQEEEQQEEKEEEKEEEDDVEEDEAEEVDGEGKTKKKKSRPRLKTRKNRRPPVAITAGENSFRTQAHELALLMQRSIETLELRERQKWDEDYMVDIHHWELEAARRVKVADVGVVDDQDMEIGDLEGVGDLDERGREIVLEWLEEKMDKAR